MLITSQAQVDRDQETDHHFCPTLETANKVLHFVPQTLTWQQEQVSMLRAYQNFVVILPRFIYELPEVVKHILLR